MESNSHSRLKRRRAKADINILILSMDAAALAIPTLHERRAVKFAEVESSSSARDGKALMSPEP